MDPAYARIGFEQRQHLLRENRPACAGHTYGDGLWIVLCHLLSRIIQSRSASGASQGAAAAFAVIEFCGGESNEPTGNFENFAGGGGREDAVRNGDWPAQAFAFRRLGLCQSGSPPCAAPGVCRSSVR